MAFTFIDRRKADKNKSAPNRQKLIKRVKGFVKTSSPSAIGQSVGGGNPTGQSPVTVASSALLEPWFAYANRGLTPGVYIGNDKFNRGDEIKNPEDGDGQGGGGAGRGQNGEDDFVVNVASNEFFDLFFEDCELPNLENEKISERLDTKMQPSGFSTTGIPAQLSVTRSYKQSLGRRRALLSPYRRELAEAEEALAAAMLAGEIDHELCSSLELKIVGLRRKIAAFDAFDKVDLRFKKKAQKPLHIVEAVLFLSMDISGSMDEHRKRIARRWFALLFAFISKRYPGAQLRFFAHTDEVFELNETDFFSTRMTGGTVVSPMLKTVNKIIRDDYDHTQTNIYFSHASDGDNYSSDDDDVYEEMIGSSGLLNKLQFFSYVETGGGLYASMANGDDTELWSSYEAAKDDEGTHAKMSMIRVTNPDDCYQMFKKVFKKK